MDINTLVDSILLRRAIAEDNACDRRSVAVNKAADIIVPLLISAALVAVVFIAASI